MNFDGGPVYLDIQAEARQLTQPSRKVEDK
jgi:hypothetical protein